MDQSVLPRCALNTKIRNHKITHTLLVPPPPHISWPLFMKPTRPSRASGTCAAQRVRLLGGGGYHPEPQTLQPEHSETLNPLGFRIFGVFRVGSGLRAWAKLSAVPRPGMQKPKDERTTLT